MARGVLGVKYLQNEVNKFTNCYLVNYFDIHRQERILNT